jgi:transcriptional regulator with XRE-family HTH domain
VSSSNRADVRDFLVTRRARITPQQAGLAFYGGNRRVPGLRREEVAMLAGVSADYYTRLEKGNLTGVSDTVLEAIVGALQLNEAERLHLLDLARAANTSPARAARRKVPQQLRPSARLILDGMTDVPAFVRNGRLDVLAANILGRALYAPAFAVPGRDVNLARFRFLDPAARDFYPDFAESARTTVELLRTEAGRDPFNTSHRPDRRAVHPQRGVPHHVGRPRRPAPPQRPQAVPAPRRRAPGPPVRGHGPGSRRGPDPDRLRR